MKKSSIFKVIAVAVVAVFVLAACATSPEPPEIETIQSDIAKNGSSIIASSAKISSVEILETIPDAETRAVTFDVQVLADDGDIEYKYYFNIEYYYGEEKEWIYGSLTAIDRNNWTVTPKTGVKDDLIRSTLLWERFTIDDESWSITEDNIESITVDSRNTQLAQGKETILVTVKVNDEVLVASGQMELECSFSNNYWRVDDYRNTVPFTSSVRPEATLDVSDDDVLAEIMQMKLPFLVGSSWNTTTQQILTLSDAEVSGFSLKNTEESNKGTRREYYHTFSLDKGLVTFDVNATSIYSYTRTDGWTRDEFTVIPVVASIDIEGTVWEGEHIWQGETPVPPPRPMTLEITEIASNGATFATVTFELENNTVIQEFRGTLNTEELTLDLQFHEWISTPLGRYSYQHSSYQRRITAYIEADTLTLQNSGGSYSSYHNVTLSYMEDAVIGGEDDDGSGDDDDGGGEE